MNPVVLKRFEQPDEVRRFEKCKIELVRIGGMTIRRASHESGWKWTTHVAPVIGMPSCQVEHVGLVLSGRARVVMDDGEQFEIGAGDLFHIRRGHDSWVIGDECFVLLDFLGADA